MFNFIVQTLKSDLVKVTSFTSLSTVIKILAGLVSVKVVAIIIGPEGIALLGQLNNFSTIILVVATGGISTGVIKYIAEYKGNDREINNIISTAFKITLYASIVCGLFLIFSSKFLSNIILKDNQYFFVFVIFGLTIIFYSFERLLTAIINGFKQFKKFVTIQIISSITSLVFSVCLVLVFGLGGALTSAVTYQSVVFFIVILFVFRSSFVKLDNLKGSWDSSTIRRLFAFSLMTIVSQTVVPIANITIRTFIIDSISTTDAGIWEGINRISSIYLMVITSSLSVYYLPRLSEINEKSELRNEIIHTYKIVMPILLFVTLAIFLFKDLIINILFTSQFIRMRDLFLLQLTGDIFKIASWLLAFQLHAKAMTFTYIWTQLLASGSRVLISLLLVSQIGLKGAVYGYMLNYILYFLLMIIVFRRLIFSTK